MLILLDVDGVLIDHRGYREAIRKTTAYFSRRLGLDPVEPDDDVVEVFESQSITMEWETDAIIVAALLLERLRAEVASPKRRSEVSALPRDVWQTLEWLPEDRISLDGRAPDLAALARRVGVAMQATGERLPSRAALRMMSDDVRAEPRLPADSVIALLDGLLADAFDIDRAPAMQVHQNFVLGDEQYTHAYQLPARVAGKPLLLEMDRPALASDLAQALLARRAAGEVFPVLYTARPSLAPVEAGPYHRGYTPEAEMARGQVGLEPVPAVGLGKVSWLAPKVRRRASDLVKPSPVHVMAAMAAARTGLEVEAVKAALAVERGDHLRYPLTACAGEAVHVFDDSPNSLRGAARAVALLNRQGLRLNLTCHGVAPAGSAKHAALAEVADVVDEDVNSGLRNIGL
jgi:hypothetical protein